MAPRFQQLEEMRSLVAESVRPPQRITVAEAAEQYRFVNNPGSYIGPWRNTTAPYLVEPMNELTSRDFIYWAFVSASQSGKTDLFLNWLIHCVRAQPRPMMLVEVSQTRASDFSIRRIDALHRDTKVVGDRLLKTPGSNTVHRKRYVTGTLLNIGWPSENELSGRAIANLFLTDYDRMDPDLGGEGGAFDLARQRATSFKRNGMTAAESSPSFPVTDPTWSPSTPHEAPPCGGILGLYNRGDRRRWYWQCVNPKCRSWFEPSFGLLEWDEKLENPYLVAESAVMKCPHCGHRYRHDGADGSPGKYEMNLGGRWLKDGQTIDENGNVSGDGPRSDMASFWLQGVAAAFKDWRTIVSSYLIALEEFIKTGDESTLKVTVNTDQAQPHIPKAHETDRLPETLRARANDFGTRVVPKGVRFLVASIDVQKNRFVVQVMGVGVGADIWVIDRFDVRWSLRVDDEAPNEGQRHRISPFTYREDWKILMREVLLKSYPLGDKTNRHMAIKVTVCDSGGGDRTTANAYEFWRWLKAGPKPEERDADEWQDWVPGLHRRFQLYRGTSNKVGYRVKLDYPDSGRKNRYAGALGEIPVLMVNVTPIKNKLDAILDRKDVGTGRINFPTWLKFKFYQELCVEIKDLKGIWQNPRNLRNESWDLFVMALSVMIERRHVGIERIDWSKPPRWAAEWDDNDLVFKVGANPLKPEAKSKDDAMERLAELARKLA